MTTSITFIVPCYNVESKIQVCFDSLDRMHTALPTIEVLLIDDVSTDRTYELVLEFAKTREWVRPIRLDTNSGTPSVPRNLGVELAHGEYVFFLDSDDELLPDGVLAELRLARSTGARAVRAPLIRDDGASRKVMNQIPDWDAKTTRESRTAAVVRYHSTTVCGLYERTLLVEHGIQWPTGQHMGEDAIYLYRLLEATDLQYSPEPDFVYMTAKVAGSTSSTQRYESRELDNHLHVWRKSSEILGRLGVDYFATRGQVALQSVFASMCRLNRGGFPRAQLVELRSLLLEHEDAVRSYAYGARFAELRDLLLAGDYGSFLEAIKTRLVIAGYDLKFILPAVPWLSEYFQVQVDEWLGHDRFDEARSRRLLGWADVIWCEWLLGNAVWYSENKRLDQRLITRMHRFELTRDFGDRIDRGATDRIVAIAPRTLEEMQARFAFDREKVRYLPNFVDVDAFASDDRPDKVWNLVMIGSVPALKGYHRALDLLHQLRQLDARYTLTVYGKGYRELPWVARDEQERTYFESCERFVHEKGLENAVEFSGWVKTSQALADKGFVLSMSDLEGSHQAVAEGFAAKCISLILPWSGSEYVYPSEYILDDVESMRDYILECRDYEVFKERAAAGHEFVRAEYSRERFVERFLDLVGEIV